MKPTLASLLAAFLVLFVTPFPSSAQILNGNMAPPFNTIAGDAANGSVANGWSAQGTADANFIRNQSSTNSPFTSIYADNASSAHIQDVESGSNTGALGYGFLQTFSTGFTDGSAGYDFMMQNFPSTGIVGVQFNNSGNITGGSSATRLRFELNNNGNLAFTTATATASPILAITAGTWYHIAFSWDVSGAFTGSATAFGGATSNFSGTLVPNAANNISGVQVRDRDENPAGDIYIDNIYVVPEPAPALMLGMAAALGLLVLSRRKAQTLPIR
ncbi:hypothetical protein BH09VER1_BH09VER1_51920 [soil metagenome]